MTKSLKRELVDISELCTIVGLTRPNLICISIYSCGEPRIFVEALELARISRVLDIPRKKIKFSTCESGNLHIDFKARGVAWTAMVVRDKVAEFYALLNAQAPRLTSQPKRLSKPPKRLLFEAVP